MTFNEFYAEQSEGRIQLLCGTKKFRIDAIV
jgi:hypothetical protein